jgi:hypothetical protein
MNKDLTELKEQYERLGEEIKALESCDYALDKLPAGTLVHYWDDPTDPKRTQLLTGHSPAKPDRTFKVGNCHWKHIEPAEHPWIGYKPNLNNSNTPPVSPDQLVQVCLREGEISETLPADRFRWNWDLGYDDIVAYRIIIEEVA